MLQRYELGLLWLPAEFRFETEREHSARLALSRRQSPLMRISQSRPLVT